MLKKQAYGQRLFEQLFWRKFGCFFRFLWGAGPRTRPSSFLLLGGVKWMLVDECVLTLWQRTKKTAVLCVLKFIKNVYQIGFFIIFAAEFQKQETMEVVSTREFRANQKKYFGMAIKGEDVILKSRNWGSFRLIPISQNDIVTNKPDLTERICQAIREVKLMREGKIKELSMDELLDEL